MYPAVLNFMLTNVDVLDLRLGTVVTRPMDET
jgi:hypothetical protein